MNTVEQYNATPWTRWDRAKHKIANVTYRQHGLFALNKHRNTIEFRGGNTVTNGIGRVATTLFGFATTGLGLATRFGALPDTHTMGKISEEALKHNSMLVGTVMALGGGALALFAGIEAIADANCELPLGPLLEIGSDNKPSIVAAK